MSSEATPQGQPYFVDQWRKIAYRLRISSKSKLVLLALIDLYARHKDGQNCYPSVESIAWDTCLSERTVQRCFDELGKAGVVHRIENPGTSNTYTFADPDTFADLMPERPPRKKLGRLSGTPDTVSPHPRQPVTPPPSACHPTPVSLSPDHSQGTLAKNTSREQQAATRTHERAEAPVRESQPPAASPSPFGVDKSQTQQGQQEGAASATRQAPTQDAAPSALESWMGEQLETRGEALTRQTDPLTPAQLGAAARAVVALASGDEARARAYVAARLETFALRGPERPVTRRALLKFLVDRRDWLAWEREEAAAQAPPPLPEAARPAPRPRAGGRPPQGTAFVTSPTVERMAAAGFFKRADWKKPEGEGK